MIRSLLHRLHAALGGSTHGSLEALRLELEALRASESRLRAALRSGRTVAWEWDLQF